MSHEHLHDLYGLALKVRYHVPKLPCKSHGCMNTFERRGPAQKYCLECAPRIADEKRRAGRIRRALLNPNPVLPVQTNSQSLTEVHSRAAQAHATRLGMYERHLARQMNAEGRS